MSAWLFVGGLAIGALAAAFALWVWIATKVRFWQ